MKFPLRSRACSVLLFLIVPILLFAQRPKVGLTLSGGGAKGMAHIGILKAIDRAGLKVDYITGTSMGSIIGAMYAAGYSGEQIEYITGRLDWDVLLSGKPSYDAVSLDEKDEYNNASVSIPFEGFKPALSTGLIESEEVWLKFSEIFFPVHHIKDFSKFNIPFKCIATDVETGKAIVIDKGEIVWAVRSSMAIPSVFAAVPYENTKLVDGGIVRNFPVKDVREMGADYVIGVNLFPGLSKAEELTTALDVMYQITNYRDAADLVEEKKLCNILIEPPLTGFSAGSFSSSAEITRIGNEIGEIYYPLFKHLADSLNALGEVEFDPNARLPKARPVVIDDIIYNGINKTSTSMLRQNLDIEIGKAYYPDDLNRSFRRAYSTLYYDNVYYELIPTVDGHAKLNVIVNEAKLSQLKVGFAYHSFTAGALHVNFTMRNLLFDKSRSIAKVAIGENWRFLFAHRQAFGEKLNNYAELSVTGDRFELPLYDHAQLKYLYKSNFYRVNLELYKLINHYWGIGIGSGRSLTYFSPSVSTSNLDKGHYSYNYLNFKVYHNNLDRKFFAREGNQILFNTVMKSGRDYYFKYNDNTDSVSQPSSLLWQISLNSEFRQALHSRLTIRETLDVGYLANRSGFITDDFLFGGTRKFANSHVPFVGLNEGQIRTNSHVAGGLGLQYKAMGELYGLANVQSMLYNFENPFHQDDWDHNKFMIGFGGGIGYNLSALPIQLMMMYSPQIGKVYTNVAIGFMF